MNSNLKDETHYQQRAIRRLGIAAVVIVLAGCAALYIAYSGSFKSIASLETSAERLAAEEVSKSFSAPIPLVATNTTAGTIGEVGVSANSYTLTMKGVVTDTNAARTANGNLPALSENTTLDDIASLRLNDMFTKQYFAHVSPSSSSAETVAAAVGYDYIALGENLALGNFVGDQGVVAAWMGSPGHRANILNTHYTQIGVAVASGTFQGSTVWIAVQIFGRPLSDCPLPDADLKSQISNDQSQTAMMQAQLQAMQAQMNSTDQQASDTYETEVNNYNTLVNQYNTLVGVFKSAVAEYNDQVSSYNQCIGS